MDQWGVFQIPPGEYRSHMDELASNALGVDIGSCFSRAVFIRDNQWIAVQDPASFDASPVNDRFATGASVESDPDGSEDVVRVGNAATITGRVYPGLFVGDFMTGFGSGRQYAFNERAYQTSDFTVELLRALRIQAESRKRGQLPNVVVSVPAAYTEAQRELMRECCRRAGFSRVEVIDDAAAAAIWNGRTAVVNRAMDLSLVYNLGGTFSASLVRHEGYKSYQVIGTVAGLPDAGGASFDQLIYDRMLEQAPAGYRAMLSPTHAGWFNSRARSIALEYCRSLKERLAGSHSIDVTTEFDSPVGPFRFSLDDLNHLIHPVLESTIEQCWRLLDMAGLTPGEVTEVILVGGSTRIPYVQQLLQHHFGPRVWNVGGSDLALCLGAGLYGVHAFRERDDRS